MSDTPASPRASRLSAPGWLDGRLVLGVLLVLVSVVVGARVLSSADRSTLVWAAAADLSAGAAITAADVQAVPVRLLGDLDDRYVPQQQDLVGQVLERPIARGDLVPRSALLERPEDLEVRLVTVPVDGARFPPGLARGQQVDVWLTPESALERAEAAADPAAPPAEPAPPAAPAAPAPGALQLVGAQPVLLQVTIDAVPDAGGSFSGGSTSRPVVLRVPSDDVARLVSAMSLGRLDLVRVPVEAERQAVLGSAAGS